MPPRLGFALGLALTADTAGGGCVVCFSLAALLTIKGHWAGKVPSGYTLIAPPALIRDLAGRDSAIASFGGDFGIVIAVE